MLCLIYFQYKSFIQSIRSQQKYKPYKLSNLYIYYLPTTDPSQTFHSLNIYFFIALIYNKHMQAGLFREPIHLNIATKGKIRKLTREIVIHHEPEVNSLVIAGRLPINQKNSPYKIKQNYFFKKHQNTQRHKKHKDSQIAHEMESGSFRAIHTACPFDALKGFPLRSNTPIKPFRRGIRSSNIPLNKHLLLQDLQTQRPMAKYNRGSHHSADLKPFTIDNVAVFQSPEYVPKYNDIQNFQQFYMYKGSGLQESFKPHQQNPKVAGTKIQPFKKYKIREILHKKSLPKHLKYQNPESLNK